MHKERFQGAVSIQVDVVVTTPLRLGRLVRRKKIDLASVQHLVLDEADKLLELKDRRSTVSHVHQVDKIMGACTHPDLVRELYTPFHVLSHKNDTHNNIGR